MAHPSPAHVVSNGANNGSNGAATAGAQSSAAASVAQAASAAAAAGEAESTTTTSVTTTTTSQSQPAATMQSTVGAAAASADIGEVEKRHSAVCAELCMDKEATRASWQSFLDVRKEHQLEVSFERILCLWMRNISNREVT